MDIVVSGRNVEVPDHYRAHVADKLSRLERYDRKVVQFDVELFHEPNRRQAKSCQRVEITGTGRGPVVRAEASAGDFYAALDCAVSKIENRLRRVHDRRVHNGRHGHVSVAEATAEQTVEATAGSGPRARLETTSETTPGRTTVLETNHAGDAERATTDVPARRWNEVLDEHEPGTIVREKEHLAKPMTVDQALYEMELVGHDFYLFSDAASGRPSVVYRRRGFDYGVIRLV